jgi:hypothetical protein
MGECAWPAVSRLACDDWVSDAVSAALFRVGHVRHLVLLRMGAESLVRC